MAKKQVWTLLILLVAAYFRLHMLDEVPPGLTHDEADHGLDAWEVVNGTRPIYFTVGYGREPLYDYATAGLMAFLGPTFLAGRLASAYFSLLMIAGTIAWVRAGFGRRVAILTAAGLAIGFWPVMTGRQVLRSITLPTILVLGFILYWRAIVILPGTQKAANRSYRRLWHNPGANFLASGLLLGLTFYTYFSSRLMWLIYPAAFLFLAISHPRRFRALRRGAILHLLTAAAIALPLFLFLLKNPQVEGRITELAEPIRLAAGGDVDPLLDNVASGLGMIPFSGDGHWRYNIPGRPLLSPLMMPLFLAGLAIALWKVARFLRKRIPVDEAQAAFVALTWLIMGLSPALVTGVDLSTPRVIGLQPVLFLFPALTLTNLVGAIKLPRLVWRIILTILFAVLAVQTQSAYFQVWANEPEVRVQYEAALVTTLDFLNAGAYEAVAISTTTPNRFHSPAIAALRIDNTGLNLRWFDGRTSLLLPQDPASNLVFSGFAPLNPYLQPYLEGRLLGEVPSRETDLDRPLILYEIDGPALTRRWQSNSTSTYGGLIGPDQPVQFGRVAELLGYDLQTPQVPPGGEVRLATFWRVNAPVDDAVLFSQIIGQDGLPMAQTDRLDAPSFYWVPGDAFVQLHQIQLSPSTKPGDYGLLIGMYTSHDTQRIPIMVNGNPVSDHIRLPPLRVRS